MNEYSNEKLVNMLKADRDPESVLLLWENVKRLATKVCRGYSESYRAEPADLLQESFIILLRAVDLYKPETGAAFSTYYVIWLHSGLQRYCDGCRPVSLPRSTLQMLRKLKKVSAEYAMKCGREPSDRECADLLGIDPPAVDALKAAGIRAAAVSLDTPVGSDDGDDPATLEDFQPAEDDPEAEVVDAIEAAEVSAALWDYARRMDASGFDLLGRKYRDGLSAEEIGDAVGLPAAKVKLLQVEAMKRARHPRNLRQIGRSLPERYQAFLFRQSTPMT